MLDCARIFRTLPVLSFAALAGLSAPGLMMGLPAYAQSNCAVWSTYNEQDGKASSLTATACSSNQDDSSAVGFQCSAKRPQLRYYPGEGAQQHLANNADMTVTFAVGDDTLPKLMHYDGTSGVFFVNIGRTDPALQMLQSGGPLDVSSDTLGTHRFRLLGSTAAIAAVMGKCGVKNYIGPPPPAPVDDTSQ